MLQHWKIVLSANLAIVTAILFSACGQKSEPDAAKAAAETVRTIPVTAATVGTGEFVQTVTATGTIVPSHQADIRAGVSGRVVNVHANVGDAVHAGDLLVEIDPELYQAQAEQARAAHEKARADLERNEKMFATQDISETIIEAARVQEKSALVALKLAEKQLRDARVRSPFRGLVASRPVELGSSVNPGEPVVSIVDIHQVKLEIGVSEEDVIHLKPGLRANVSLDAYPNRQFSGKVITVGPQADPASRLFPVEIAIKNTEDFALRGGMVARAQIEFERMPNAVLLPHDAVLEREGEAIVYVIENGVARRRAVQLGALQDTHYLVKSGVTAGEVVVTSGQEALMEGTKVEVQPQ